jgi:hypothetical protein
MPVSERPQKIKGREFKEPIRQFKNTLELAVFKEKKTVSHVRPYS